MDFLLLLKAPGYVFGPLMLLGGLAALVACARATRRADRAARRRALVWALVPLAVGAVAAAFGAVRWGLSGQVAPDRAFVWGLLGYTVLFGTLVTAGPLAWAAVLAVRRPVATA